MGFVASLMQTTIISIEICWPLAVKLRNLKLSKIAFQVAFGAKTVARLSFGKLKKEGAPSCPPTPLPVHNTISQPGLNRVESTF